MRRAPEDILQTGGFRAHARHIARAVSLGECCLPCKADSRFSSKRVATPSARRLRRLRPPYGRTATTSPSRRGSGPRSRPSDAPRPPWAIRPEDPCNHSVTEVANLLRLALQAAEGEHNLLPPPPDPVVPAEGLAFCLCDQGRELHVGVDSHEEPVNVATVDCLVAFLSVSTFSCDIAYSRIAAASRASGDRGRTEPSDLAVRELPDRQMAGLHRDAAGTANSRSRNTART